MKKIKLATPIVAIFMGALTAFASRSRQACTMEPQFYFNGSSYVAAGTLGTDYYCASGGNTCTYIFFSDNTYQPCQTGTYHSMHLKARKN